MNHPLHNKAIWSPSAYAYMYKDVKSAIQYYRERHIDLFNEFIKGNIDVNEYIRKDFELFNKSFEDVTK